MAHVEGGWLFSSEGSYDDGRSEGAYIFAPEPKKVFPPVVDHDRDIVRRGEAP